MAAEPVRGTSPCGTTDDDAEAGVMPDYRFRFSVSTSSSSDTVMVFELAW